MSLGIYKPGQGYWVRIMSAALAGLLVATLAYWVYGQMLVLSERLPRSGYIVGTDIVPPTPFKPGEAVELLSRAEGAAAPDRIATGTVEAADGRRVTLNNVQRITPKIEPTGANLLRRVPATPDSVEPGLAITKGQVIGVSPIEPALLGGIAVAVVGLVGAGLAYWFIAVKPRTVEFLIATDFEMTKVNWSTPREIMGHTWVVIGACFLLATSLWVVDQALVAVFQWIDLLPKVGQ